MFKKILTFILIGSFSLSLFGQSNSSSFIEEVKQFQQELNDQYSDSAHSPLLDKDRLNFNGHDFFEPNPVFYVQAKFKRTENEEVFEMKTSTSRRPTYKKYGEIKFKINGKKFKLNIYQNQRLMNNELYADHLFLPFTDLTNGEESYGGGRYIDLTISDSKTMIINFNKAYNPYCCYNSRYSCPIPPKENHLNIKVTAGVKAFKEGEH
tara:strand:+ start:160 stop:783 length:624 start_codon:yes stop_codon:yes gene_type:complete